MRSGPTLSHQRAKVLEFIQAECADGGTFPTLDAIRAHMGWKGNAGVYDVMHALVGLGFLTRKWVRGGWRWDLVGAAAHGGAL